VLPQRPNILLIAIDCLRADRTLGPQRSAHIPTMQALVQRGAAFSQLITVNSVTIPCVTSLFSGMYPIHTGVRGMVRRRIPDGFPLLAEILQAAGYHTCAEPTVPLIPQLHLDRGFETYHARKGVDEPFVEKWGERLIARLKNRELPSPWFLYLHLWEVHQPRYVLPRYNTPQYGKTLYDRAISGLDARLGELLQFVDDNTLILITGDHGEKIPESRLEAQIERQKNWTKQFLKRIGIPYRFRSAFIGSATRGWYRVTRLLRRIGIIKSPLVTLTGHGYHVYDDLVRVPLILAGPGVPVVDRLITEQVRQIDLLPTILELAGMAERIPSTTDGRSLVPLLHAEPWAPAPTFIESWVTDSELSPFHGVRTNEWKYIYAPRTPDENAELFDLRVDPAEKHNVAAAHPEIVAEMRRLAQQHFQAPPLTREADGALTAEEEAILTENLRELGYIE